MTVIITLTGAGTNTGPTFNLFSSIDGIGFTQIASSISKTTLQAGYTATVVSGTTIIRITSIGVCTDSYDATVIPPSTTTSTTSSTTSTSTDAPTTSTTSTTSTSTTLPTTTSTTTTSTTTVPPTTTSTTTSTVPPTTSTTTSTTSTTSTTTSTPSTYLCSLSDVTIGTQTWAACNLNVSKYFDGTDIPYVPNSEWNTLTTGAWCYPDDDEATGDIYGKYYNWYAVNDTIHGGLAPDGYHVPTDAEWSILTTYLGGESNSSNELRSTGPTWGTCVLDLPNNLSGWSGLGGTRRTTGYSAPGDNAYFWSATEDDTSTAWSRKLLNCDNNVYRESVDKHYGYSVRLIQD